MGKNNEFYSSKQMLYLHLTPPHIMQHYGIVLCNLQCLDLTGPFVAFLSLLLDVLF